MTSQIEEMNNRTFEVHRALRDTGRSHLARLERGQAGDLEFVDAAGKWDRGHSDRTGQASVGECEDALACLQEVAVRLGRREIGEIVNCPENTVKTRMYHARKALKSVLERER